MPTLESGLDKNLALYQQVLTLLKEPDWDYQAPVSNLTIDKLETYVAPMSAALGTAKDRLADYQLAVAPRHAAYEDMKARLTRINDLLPLLGIDERTLANAKLYYDKVKGYSANSEQGFENLKKNFESYLALLKKLPAYQPTDAPLTVAALQQLNASMDSLNQAVAQTEADLTTARNQRNELMFNDNTGIVPLCKKIKQVYRSKEGLRGIHYKQLVALLKPLR
ncbi:MAG: hypothetical protein ACK5JD_02890 [Mangrovibacterium sp.]